MKTSDMFFIGAIAIIIVIGNTMFTDILSDQNKKILASQNRIESNQAEIIKLISSVHPYEKHRLMHTITK